MGTISDNKVLEAFNILIPYLHYFFEDDIAVGINDDNKCLRFVPNINIPTNAKDGDSLRPGSASYECMKKGDPVSMVVPKEVLGTALKSIAVPVKDESGRVVGSFSIAKSLKRQEEILEISKNLSSALEQMAAAINEVSAGIQEVVDSNAFMTASAKEAENRVGNTDNIIKFVKDVSGETNLLGLNAAIEAARAGESGRGFSIVAQEIRKLSNSSNKSIGEINEVLKKVKESVSGIVHSIDEANKVFQEQVSAIQQITASIQELNSMSKMLENMASRF